VLLHRGPGRGTVSREHRRHHGIVLLATGSWILRGRHHFMRDVPEGHDTRSADEIFYE